MERLLVTGGAGFIGANFVRLLAKEADYDLVVLDKLTYAGNLANIQELVDGGEVTFHQGDITDARAVREAMKGCDGVVHFAAETHVDRSIVEAGTFVTTDVFGTFVLLEAARRQGVERFVHISTDEVYGEAEGEDSTEEASLRPKSPYAASKAGADRLAYAYHATYGLPVVITRCVNNYGPWQHPEKAVPLFTLAALLNEPLPVYGTGENRREWIHVEDHCRALRTILEHPSLEGQVYNIGTGERKSTLQVAEAVLEALDKPKDLISLVDDRPGHVLSHAVDSARVRIDTGWTHSHTFEASLAGVVRWYADHILWWRSTLLGSARNYFEARHPRLIAAAEELE
ncbi:MAG: dTDP-glucose 4,6-dehydratase [Thermoplasmata archaeon]|nr:dTDP-glucose 4,6-dehydratase [Thermoplasmata archaeon]